MTVSAPATSAFAMSPEYCSPPSAITGMPASRAASDASYTAVTWGTPTPATMRVVQIEPGPTPTLTASTPASMSACAPSRVATLPPMTSMWSNDGVGLEPADDVDDPGGLAVGGVDHEHVDSRVAQRLGALPRVAEEADGRADAQAALLVLGGERVLLALVEVLDRDEAGELAVVVDQRQLLDAVLREDRDDVVRADADVRRDEALARHDVLDEGRRALEARDEAHVAVRDDADQLPVGVDDRKTRDAELRAQRLDLVDRRVGRGRDRVRDHARLAALHAVDLRRLLLDRQIAMQDAEAALARDGDRHARFGDGVHRARDERRGDRDPAGHPRRRVGLARDDIGVSGQEQDVVVGESDEAEGVVVAPWVLLRVAGALLEVDDDGRCARDAPYSILSGGHPFHSGGSRASPRAIPCVRIRLVAQECCRRNKNDTLRSYRR